MPEAGGMAKYIRTAAECEREAGAGIDDEFAGAVPEGLFPHVPADLKSDT